MLFGKAISFYVYRCSQTIAACRYCLNGGEADIGCASADKRLAASIYWFSVEWTSLTPYGYGDVLIESNPTNVFRSWLDSYWDFELVWLWSAVMFWTVWLVVISWFKVYYWCNNKSVHHEQVIYHSAIISEISKVLVRLVRFRTITTTLLLSFITYVFCHFLGTFIH